MAPLQKPMLWLSIGFVHLLFVVALFGDWLRPYLTTLHTRRGLISAYSIWQDKPYYNIKISTR